MSNLLISFDGTGKEHVEKIINSGMFENVFLITKNHKLQNTHVIDVNIDAPLEELFSNIYISLKKIFGDNKIIDLDMGVNMHSGSGKLHTAMLAALMKLGYGIRLIDLDANGEIVEF